MPTSIACIRARYYRIALLAVGSFPAQCSTSVGPDMIHARACAMCRLIAVSAYHKHGVLLELLRILMAALCHADTNFSPPRNRLINLACFSVHVHAGHRNPSGCNSALTPCAPPVVSLAPCGRVPRKHKTQRRSHKPMRQPGVRAARSAPQLPTPTLPCPSWALTASKF